MVNSKHGFESIINNKHEHYTQLCGPCVGYSENHNFSNAQKELLLWHWKWGISINHIQEMMKPQQFVELDGTRSVMTPVISTKLVTATTCAVTACESCFHPVHAWPWLNQASTSWNFPKNRIHML